MTSTTWLSLLCLLVPLAVRAEPRLAYVTNKDEYIYTARAADGRGPRRVCKGEEPCLSRDGRRLTYTRRNGPPGSHHTSTVVLRDLVSGEGD